MKNKKNEAFLQFSLAKGQKILEKIQDSPFAFAAMTTHLKIIKEKTKETEPTPGISITFKGKPINESFGMDAGFAASALESIASILTPHLITNVVHGSFGFHFEPQKISTSEDLVNAIASENKLIELLEASNAGSEEFQQIASETDPDVLEGVLSLLRISKTNEVSFNINTPKKSIALSVEQIESSFDILSTLDRTENTEIAEGTLTGIQQKQKTFEIFTQDDVIIKGRLHRSLDLGAKVWEHYLNKYVIVELLIKKTRRQGKVVRDSTVLKSIKIKN